jgi:DNA-binding NarL/FixJ family response regulator
MPASKAILVTGSDSEVYDLLVEASSARDWLVKRSKDTAETLVQLQSTAYDLLITDVNTPGTDDVALLRRVHKMMPGAKVVVLTSESTPNDILEAMREHAFAYFCKPFDPDVLTEMVTRALDLPAWEDGIEVVSACPEWIALRVRCQALTAERLFQFMRELRIDLPQEEQEAIAVAFREILLNAIEHGGQFDPNKRVYIECGRTKRILIYHVRDPGKGFSFEALPHAAISNPPNAPAAHLQYRTELNMRAGGFGILVTRNLVDELIYNERGNEVLLVKYL